jgi:hypothetical protein
MSIKIRKYVAQDRQLLIELWQEVFPDPAPHNEPSKVIDEKLNQDDLIVVAENTNQIIGSCIVGYDGHRGWLYAVAVAPEYRRQKVGARLVSHSMDELKALGCTKVNLQIRSTNTPVVSFYKSIGFQVEDRLSMGVLID